MNSQDKEELALYRKIAEINVRLEILEAIKLIRTDVKHRRPISNRISIGGQPSSFDH